MNDELSELLRAAVESGDWAPFEKRLVPAAVLRSRGEGGRRRIDGAAAVLELLARPGPGRVAAWETHEWQSGQATELWSAAARASQSAPGVKRGVGSALNAEHESRRRYLIWS